MTEQVESLTFPMITESVHKLYASGVRTIVLMDFDGVINSSYMSGTFSKKYYNQLVRTRVPNPYYDSTRSHKGRVSAGLHIPTDNPKSYLIQYAPEMVTELNMVFNRDDVQVIWVTSWRGHMAMVSKELGITHQRSPVYLPWGDDAPSAEHILKVKPVGWFLHEIKDDMRVIWVDDTILAANHRDYTASFIPDNVETLLLGPESRYGLSRQEVKRMHDFAGVEDGCI